ncbi:RNA-guided endonuclease InsQ/TnpB family protein [Streptomyces sp. NPDC048243]|uniref:RNA-guided endonuclease InsQ/TnpB family protein n=1 Tax=Streptomyces sp. NPDC048243 TaxID=3365522 RepID=UPI003723DF4A
MKLVVRVKLLPTPEQASALEATLRACNRAAGHVARVAFEQGVTSRNDLQRLVYAEVKASFGLSAQPTVRVVKKVVDAYAARRGKAPRRAVVFRPEAAQPFDDRCLSWQIDAGTVSVWTLAGRMKGLSFVCSPDQLKTLANHRKGESDLVREGGKWFLAATCEVPEQPVYEPVDWIGVDRGIVNLATTSDGVNYQGRRLGRHRRRHARKREIVAVAQRTGRGIAVEHLDGIRERVRLRRDQRAAFTSWPFRQLGDHLSYKARRAGVPFVEVDAAYTSQRCPRCGHTARANRATRENFTCRLCGLAGPADVVAGVNVRDRACSAWVFVTTPAFAPSSRGSGWMRPVTVLP